MTPCKIHQARISGSAFHCRPKRLTSTVPLLPLPQVSDLLTPQFPPNHTASYSSKNCNFHHTRHILGDLVFSPSSRRVAMPIARRDRVWRPGGGRLHLPLSVAASVHPFLRSTSATVPNVLHCKLADHCAMKNRWWLAEHIDSLNGNHRILQRLARRNAARSFVNSAAETAAAAAAAAAASSAARPFANFAHTRCIHERIEYGFYTSPVTWRDCCIHEFRSSPMGGAVIRKAAPQFYAIVQTRAPVIQLGLLQSTRYDELSAVGDGHSVSVLPYTPPQLFVKMLTAGVFS